MEMIVDLGSIAEIKSAIDLLTGLVGEESERAETPAPKAPRAPKKAKPAPKAAELPEEDNDDDLFEDNDSAEESEVEYSIDDCRQALATYAKENGGKGPALKILKKFSKTGKLDGLNKSDYADLIAALS